MNRERELRQIREQSGSRPSILGNERLPSLERVLRLAPMEAIPAETTGQWDAVILDNSLCFEPEPILRLHEIHQLLKNDGLLIIGDVVRLRRLPSDLDNKDPLWIRGLANAILDVEYQSLLISTGFAIVESRAAEVDINALISRYDGSLRGAWESSVAVSDEDWIASTQACCGLGAPKSEALAEILKCDNIEALWATRFTLARKQASDASVLDSHS